MFGDVWREWQMETSALFLHWSPSLATVAVDVSTAGCLTTARRLAVEDLLLWQVAIKKPVADGIFGGAPVGGI